MNGQFGACRSRVERKGESEEEEEDALERGLNGVGSGDEWRGDDGLRGGDDDEDKSDSSLDLHTPWPRVLLFFLSFEIKFNSLFLMFFFYSYIRHLMHGPFSPNSKLLPGPVRVRRH